MLMTDNNADNWGVGDMLSDDEDSERLCISIENLLSMMDEDPESSEVDG